MFLLPYADLTIPPDRQRREFSPHALAELAGSIDRLGLMHPIVVCPEVGGGWRLIAGERRLRAVQDCHALGGAPKCGDRAMPEGQIACITLGELSLLAQQEAELEENVQRVDLTWQERAAAYDRLHRLRAAQAEARGESQSFKATATEISGETGPDFTEEQVRASVIVARHFDNPEVARAKSLRDAVKVIKKQEAREAHTLLAETIGPSFTAAKHSLIMADCRTWMQGQPPHQFDVIITDPPYGMGADQFGDSGGRMGTDHRYLDDAAALDDFLKALPAITCLAKPAAHIYIFCDIDGFARVRGRLIDCGWSAFRTPLIMPKRGQGRVPFPEHGPSRQYELIAYAWRGGKPVTAIYPDILKVDQTEDNLGFSAQKPVAAYLDLLRRSVRPGDTVFDPYCGTGTIFPAAQEMLCAATGIESNPATYGIAVGRLEALKST